MPQNHDTLKQVLNGLMRRYKERVPDVPAIFAAMNKEGLLSDPSEIENDHIAFRTLGVPHLGISRWKKYLFIMDTRRWTTTISRRKN